MSPRTQSPSLNERKNDTEHTEEAFEKSTGGRESTHKSKDLPPLDIIVIRHEAQETPMFDGPQVFAESSNVQSPKRSSHFGDFSSVSKLMPRKPLPVPPSCVSLTSTPASDRKRCALAIASSNVEEEASSRESPRRVAKKFLPMGPPRNRCPSSSFHPASPFAKVASAEGYSTEMDFLSVENLSLKSPIPSRRKCSDPGKSPGSSLVERERSSSFSNYIASPARSLHSSFTDYVPSPALPTATPSPSHFNADRSITSHSPRKVPLKVLSQFTPAQRSPAPRCVVPSTPSKPSRKGNSSPTSPLLYSPDGSEPSNDNIPTAALQPSLEPIDSPRNPTDNTIGDLITTPKRPGKVYSFTSPPPRTKRNLRLLTPKTPLPKLKLTPRRTPRSGGSGSFSLLPKSTRSTPRCSSMEANVDLDDLGPVSASLFGGFSPREPMGSCRVQEFSVSPRMLFPPSGSRLFDQPGSPEYLIHQSFESHSSRRSNQDYLSDSEDEDAFVLAAPKALRPEESWRSRQAVTASAGRASKIARR